MLCRVTQDGRVMVGSPDKMQSTGEGSCRSLHHSCLENPMNRMKRQKDRTLKDQLCRLVGAQYATGEEWRENSRRMKSLSQSEFNTQLWMCLLVKVKCDAVKNNIA